jgi:hypothetical protein
MPQTIVALAPHGRAAADQRFLVKCVPVYLRARVRDVGQYAGGAQEHIVLDDRASVDGDVVLNFDVVSDD